MTYTHHNRHTASPTKQALGITPAELCILVAIISHERVYGESPSRAAIATFLKVQPKGYRLIRIGWIRSRLVVLAPGKYLAIWSATDAAKRALGVEWAERRSA